MTGLLRSNVTVAAGTTVSRVTGLLRLTALLAVIGKNPLSDAYLIANETPNIVYELLVGGVLSATLVPLFTSFDVDDDDEARDVVITVAVALFTALTAVAVLAAPLVFGLFTRNVGDEVDAALFRSAGTALARIFLVQILFYGLVGLANAYLNSRRRFFAAAWSPVLPNLIIIATLLSLPSPGEGGWLYTDVLDDARLRLTLGLGATLGIASMALVLLPAARAAGLRPRLRWDPRHPAVRRLASLSFWTFGFVAANIVALTVVRNLTEPGSGESTAYLSAFTFFMLPHGLLGVSIATTFQPDMARAVARRDQRGFVRSASLGIRMTALLTIPAGIGVFVLRRPLVGATLQYRQLDAASADLIADALAGFAPGLGAFSIYLFVLRAFYSHQDTKTAFKVNVVENALNIALGIVLVAAFGVVGLSASFALAYAVSALWVLQILSYKVPAFSARDVLAAVGRFVVAAALMGEAVWLVTRGIGADAGVGAIVRIVVGVVVGVGVYAGLLVAMGASELEVLRERIPGGRICSPTSLGGMLNLLKRRWKYLVAKLGGRSEAGADPRVQLEQALAEAHSQHRRLKEQAANVIANQKQAEIRLGAKMEELERLDANARQALVMAGDAQSSGDAAQAAEYTRAAETIADRLLAVESDVEGLKAMVLESTRASDQAKEAVRQNSRLLQERIAERSKLMSQMDQARMQEEMNSAMASLTESVGDDVPTLDEVRAKIEERYARAVATAELGEADVESRVREIEQATANVAARDRLSRMRSELGLAAATTTPLESGGPAPTSSDDPSGRAPPRTGGSADRRRPGVEHDEGVAVDHLVLHPGREVRRVPAAHVAERSR